MHATNDASHYTTPPTNEDSEARTFRYPSQPRGTGDTKGKIGKPKKLTERKSIRELQTEVTKTNV